MRKILILLALIVSMGTHAQAPGKFVTSFGGLGVDIGYGVKETYHRQYIFVGSTTSYGAGASDAYLALIDSMGQIVWQKTYGGVFAEQGKSVIVNPLDSGYIFTGFTNSYGNGGYDIYVVRTDKNGDFKWQSSFGGLDWDFGKDLIIADDGNIIVCGNTFSSRYGKSDGVILKLDVNTGSMLWEKKYGGSENDDFVSIQKTSDGFYTLAGNTNSYFDLNNDFWMFKINNLGDSISSKSFGDLNKAEKCYDFMEDNDHNLVFCGAYDTSFYNSGKNIAYAMQTDLNGSLINSWRSGGAFTPDDKFVAVTNMKRGSQYCFSRKVRHGALGIDAQPYALNYNFIFLGTNTFGGQNEEEVFDIISTSDNGYVMIGYTNSYSSSEEVYMVKTDSVLSTVPLIVGVAENSLKYERRKVYYYDNTLYFPNDNKGNLTYQILDAKGMTVLTGETKNAFLNIHSLLENNIYIFRIIESGLKLKFIKD